MKDKKRIIIGTRGSKLALWQAEWTKSELIKKKPHLEIILEIIKTKGDKILDVPLAKLGGKGLFVKEIEDSLLRNDIDLAVHSMKDVPMDLPKGLHLSAICQREDPRDAFISLKYDSLKTLPIGATVGTSSLRRSCQLKHGRQDLKIKQLRGNIDTRIRKLMENQYDAILLAAAGVIRLGWSNKITEILDTSTCMPAVGQGAIGIECRENDAFVSKITSFLNHQETSICVRAERVFLRKLEGGCQVPIAAHARVQDHKMFIFGLVGSVDGKILMKETFIGNTEDPEGSGLTLAENLLQKGAHKLLL